MKQDETSSANMAAGLLSDSAPPFLHGEEICIKVEDLNLYYGSTHALQSVNMDIAARRVTALIGPSGCGKSTLLRCFNRMNDLVDSCRIIGHIKLNDADIYDRRVDVPGLRQRVGMVFQKPNPFPKTIFENVAYGLRLQGIRNKRILADAVEKSLRAAALWDEVKDRLDDNAFGLSGGQQQRLVIARAVAVEPEVILLDEPTSALDPLSTAKVEALIDDLKKKYTIIIVTHNMQQAARVADNTAFMYLGSLIEYGDTGMMFQTPKSKRTQDYITGRFG